MRILDLFAGAGGAAWGYHLAFPDAEIVGVDVAPQPNYPFTFVQSDALEFLSSVQPGDFDLIHASPPCQAHTSMSNRWRGQNTKADSHTDYIAAVRWKLTMLGTHYVIENVTGARKQLIDPIILRGGAFGLGVDRPRLFECSFPVLTPGYLKVTNPVGVYGEHHDGRRLFTRKDGSIQRAARTLEEAAVAMGGVDWMTWRELAESIPPTYTEFIGRAFAAAAVGVMGDTP